MIERKPRTIRMMLTGYTEINVAVDAINRGEIYRLITKPWNEPPPRGSQEPPAFDPALDTRVVIGAYGVIASPVDDAVWIVSDDFPGRMLRLDVRN